MDDESQKASSEISPELLNTVNRIRRKVTTAAERFETKNRCTNTTVILMLSLVTFYYLLQLLFDFLFVGFDLGIASSLVGIFSWLTFYVWTTILGWNKADYAVKKLLTSEKGTEIFAKYVFPFLGLTPIVDLIPAIIAGVLLNIILIKAQDALYNATQGRVDEEVIMEGIAFFDMFRNIYTDSWTQKPRYQPKQDNLGNTRDKPGSNTRTQLKPINYTSAKNPVQSN